MSGQWPPLITFCVMWGWCKGWQAPLITRYVIWGAHGRLRNPSHNMASYVRWDVGGWWTPLITWLVMWGANERLMTTFDNITCYVRGGWRLMSPSNNMPCTGEECHLCNSSLYRESWSLRSHHVYLHISDVGVHNITFWWHLIWSCLDHSRTTWNHSHHPDKSCTHYLSDMHNIHTKHGKLT